MLRRLTKSDWQIINRALARLEADELDDEEHEDFDDVADAIASARIAVHDRLARYADPYGEES